jgi:class 3 adenylate cyclase/tetratricopeptide (TPR) repeat protein
MNCPKCGTANPEGAKFCMECGASSTQTCPHCASSLPAGAKFCFNCGHQMATAAPAASPTQVTEAPKAQAASPQTRLHQFVPKELLNKLESARSSGMEGERRVVTMLFCDVKGSTAAASALDPEEWAEIINGAFEAMIHPIYRYEGTVARLMGDGILAFFGAPVAHEDDPQRAVLAGLAITEAIQPYRQQIQQRWGLDLNVRVGINTGLVVVGAVGSDLRMEYTALGDAINLAARMEQSARPGTVQIAEATYKMVAPLFDVEVLEGLELKGKNEPVQAYRVIGPRMRPGNLRGIAGLRAPLIGRSHEIETMHAAIDSLQNGCGQLFSVMGEAGLGKSRLVAELRDELATKGSGRLQWLEGRSLSYETATPYAPFVDILSDCLGLQADHSDRENYGRLKQRVTALFPQQADQVAPSLASLLGLELPDLDSERIKYLEPPLLRGKIFMHVAAFFERLAAEQPLVLFFDDVHWIDPTSLELLESLFPLAGRAPILIAIAFRPRRQEPCWRLHEAAQHDCSHCYTSITLQPLNPNHSRELVANLLHVEDLPEKVRLLILDKAEGNPFFVEEVIRSLLDAQLVVRKDGRWHATREIANIAVPDTLIGVITARLDRLEEQVRQSAQAASVLGREFDYETLAHLLAGSTTLDADLAELIRRDVVREKSRLPRRTFAFKHVLTQEAAYNSILLSRRRELHLQAAHALRQSAPERPADIARHFLDARQPAQAMPYLVAAGEMAARAYSSAEAIEFYQRAIELRSNVENLEPVRRAYEGLGNMQSFANQIPEAFATFQAMFNLARTYGDTGMQVSALNKLANLLALRLGQFAEAEIYLAQAEQISQAHNDIAGVAEGSLIRCRMCTAMADFDSVIKHMGHLAELGREVGSKENLVMGLEHVSTTLVYLTRFNEAWGKAQETLKAAQEAGDRMHESAILSLAIPYCQIQQGDFAGADRSLRQGMEIADRIGAVFCQVYGYWLLGELARWRGDYEDAIAYLQRALDYISPFEEFMPFAVVQPLGALGSVYLEISKQLTGSIVKFHHHALRLLESPAATAGGGTAWADMGWCALALEDHTLAQEFFQQGLNQPSMFMWLERPRLLAGLGMVALARGQTAEALSRVEEARHYASERGMRYFYPLLDLSIGRVHAAMGHFEQALAAYAAAESVGIELQMWPWVWQIQAAAAQLLEASGDRSGAEEKWQSARKIIEECSARFRDESLRRAYLAGALDSLYMGATGMHSV